jgi:hypothetical protein
MKIDGRENVMVRSSKRFENTVEKNEVVVVMFYRRDKEILNDKAMRDKVERMERRIQTLATRDGDYRNAGVRFLMVNVAKEKLGDLAQEYEVDVTDNPVFVLFHNGKPVRKNGAIVRLAGFVSTQKLCDFIDHHLREQIEDILAAKKEAREQRQEEIDNALYFGAYPYYYGYPYGAYGYYWNWPYYGAPYGGYGYPYGGASIGLYF